MIMLKLVRQIGANWCAWKAEEADTNAISIYKISIAKFTQYTGDGGDECLQMFCVSQLPDREKTPSFLLHRLFRHPKHLEPGDGNSTHHRNLGTFICAL